MEGGNSRNPKKRIRRWWNQVGKKKKQHKMKKENDRRKCVHR